MLSKETFKTPSEIISPIRGNIIGSTFAGIYPEMEEIPVLFSLRKT